MNALKWLDKNLEKYILVCLLIVIVCVVSHMVFMRVVFNSPPFWSGRVSQYAFVISTFFSISYCIRRGASLKIDMLLGFSSNAVRKAITVSVKVIMLVFFALLTYASWGVIGQFTQLGTIDTALEVPMSFFFSIIFLGFVLTTIRCVQALVFEFFPENEG